MTERHQRIGASSNAQAGSDFEVVARAYFLESEGITLDRQLAIPLGVAGVLKAHRFDLASERPPMLVECKSHRWTETGNLPSAKITVLNEAMYLFHLAPDLYRKVLFMPRSVHFRRRESLAEYYVRVYGHLIPLSVEVIEYDEDQRTVRSIKSATASH